MPLQIVRTPEEVDRVRVKAQELSFKAEDEEGEDEVADVIYGLTQWLLGDDDNDPVSNYLSDDDRE